MISFITCFHTQWEVFFQGKFHAGMKFYLFHPRVKLTCEQKSFHPGTSFIPGWDFISVPERFGIYVTNLSLKCINRVGVLINNLPAIQFSYKFEFILCKNCETTCKDINQTLNCVCFPWNSLESSFDSLGVTMKSQKWSKSEALGSNYTLKSVLTEYCVVK